MCGNWKTGITIQICELREERKDVFIEKGMVVPLPIRPMADACVRTLCVGLMVSSPLWCEWALRLTMQIRGGLCLMDQLMPFGLRI